MVRVGRSRAGASRSTHLWAGAAYYHGAQCIKCDCEAALELAFEDPVLFLEVGEHVLDVRGADLAILLSAWGLYPA